MNEHEYVVLETSSELMDAESLLLTDFELGMVLGGNESDLSGGGTLHLGGGSLHSGGASVLSGGPGEPSQQGGVGGLATMEPVYYAAGNGEPAQLADTMKEAATTVGTYGGAAAIVGGLTGAIVGGILGGPAGAYGGFEVGVAAGTIFGGGYGIGAAAAEAGPETAIDFVDTAGDFFEAVGDGFSKAFD